MLQERVASLFTCTVQQPHSPAPQPKRVPVNPSSSRRYHSRGVSSPVSTRCFSPLIVNSTMAFSDSNAAEFRGDGAGATSSRARLAPRQRSASGELLVWSGAAARSIVRRALFRETVQTAHHLCLDRSATEFGTLASTLDRDSIPSSEPATRASRRGRVSIVNSPGAAAAALAGARRERDALDMTTPPAAAPSDAPR